LNPHLTPSSLNTFVDRVVIGTGLSQPRSALFFINPEKVSASSLEGYVKISLI